MHLTIEQLALLAEPVVFVLLGVYATIVYPKIWK